MLEKVGCAGTAQINADTHATDQACAWQTGIHMGIDGTHHATSAVADLAHATAWYTFASITDLTRPAVGVRRTATCMPTNTCVSRLCHRASTISFGFRMHQCMCTWSMNACSRPAEHPPTDHCQGHMMQESLACGTHSCPQSVGPRPVPQPACGPGHPELSKYYMDTAFKLFALTFTFTFYNDNRVYVHRLICQR